ncbi:hypothetical protein RB628_04875 [Streptomyces sp. ADMS]|uniref:hypothetical protein n=1 Tax=Streptomyces sp. ADMS TaxID=3071415 RepID=UPI00296E9912|nr:hypothetical protein [Streptomyces sp. ADMS]MDW4904694.1 hypothetical protein [Streptomyces sp. ADMS]
MRLLSVRMTAELEADLEVLRRGGMTASDAVRHAVKLIAQAQRAAELPAVDDGRRRPAALTIRTRHLYGRPPAYDGPEQGV